MRRTITIIMIVVSLIIPSVAFAGVASVIGNAFGANGPGSL